jgi:hypothetical protein
MIWVIKSSSMSDISGSGNMKAFWDIALCSLVEADQVFRSACRLHHKNDAPLKRLSTYTRLHWAISQKEFIFKLQGVYKTCNIHTGGEKCTYNFSAELSTKTLDRRPRCTWIINNIFNIREISFEAMGLTDLSQGGIQWLGFVNTGMNF